MVGWMGGVRYRAPYGANNPIYISDVLCLNGHSWCSVKGQVQVVKIGFSAVLGIGSRSELHFVNTQFREVENQSRTIVVSKVSISLLRLTMQTKYRQISDEVESTFWCHIGSVCHPYKGIIQTSHF